jgi:prophage antirepressor-like protein
MQALQIFTEGSWSIRTQVSHETPYFNGKDIAKALGYTKNPQKAFRDHTFEEDRLQRKDIRGSAAFTPSKNEQGTSIYLTEPGVYGLIFGSKLESAKQFKKWVCQEVLPRLRKHYAEQARAPLCLQNEAQMHCKLIKAIRRLFPQALMTAGLGELQDTPEKRIDAWRKGYQAGTPDIVILNSHKSYNGLAFELKNPKGTGKASEKQLGCLESYRRAGFQTEINDDYDCVLLTVFKYMQDTRLICECCGHKFKTNETLCKHLKCFHRC